MSSFKLVVTMSGKEGTVLSEHLFDKEQVTLGRILGNDVVLPDVEKRVSSKHARIERAGGAWQVVDLGSTNGTFLNNRKLEPNHGTPVKEGDKIGLGLYQVKFVPAEEAVDRTIVMVDPSRYTAELAEELPVLYARHVAEDPEKRRQTLRDALKTTLSAVGPENARAILTQLRSRFRPGEERLIPERTTELRRKDSEAAQADAVLQAGTKALSEISTRFLGEGRFETAAQMEQFGKLISQALELTLEWISKSLSGRREFEVQFSADLSMIFSKEKNPLKTGGGPQEMGRFLLDWRSPRTLQSVRDALDGAFRDLTMHQLGLLAGVQESLGAVLRRLDPKAVETDAKEKGGGGMFASLEKRAWKRYEEIFNEIFSENSKLFNEMIYPNVRKGYLALHSEPAPQAEGTPKSLGAANKEGTKK